MDPIGVASSVVSLITTAVLFRNYVKGREGLLDRQKWKNSIRLGPSEKRFNGACDIAVGGESRWQYLWDDEVEAVPQGETRHHLPPQTNQSIRLEVIEEGSDGPQDTFPVATGFMQLSKQWQRAYSDASYHITTYETAWPVKVTRFIKVWEEDQKKCVLITCDTYARKQPSDGFSDFYAAKQIRIQIKLLDASYITVRSKDNWKQLFLLQFHHACLKLFIAFLNALESDEIDHADDATTDPSLAELRQWNLKTITKRSYEYRDLAEMGRKLISTTESLIDVVRSTPPVVDSSTHANKLMAIDMELRGYCREANEQLQKFSDRLDHDLKYLELARNINQTRGVQQLTLLATIFLPLSLAAGVLSMQTRFKDLGTLLYDFFGVVVLLAAIVLIIMILLSLMTVLNELDTTTIMELLESLAGPFMHTILCGGHRPQRPLNPEDRPNIPIPANDLDAIVTELSHRGDFTHAEWGKCLAKLEDLKAEHPEPDLFAVLDAMELAFRELVVDLKTISDLKQDAEQDSSVLLYPELDIGEAKNILFGEAADKDGHPIEKYIGIVKLHTLALPQLGTFLAMQNNGAITIAMIFQILKLHGIVENKGEGEWLRPLKETLGNSLYEQIMEAHKG
ncbi:uncharacterized protein BKA55DRAFT_708962 [Fusarium redolens]|uniref:Uncharacterized protein n=1 Tax=Fusarium redolens TaxID=48865 RepID=A0A9P9GAH5_FUSRE|nr:uncharacterized protein BKA55DRAFT_708962 [Fusarium redolens]KAH7235025.1 hypothetical protein BKA55DRAFT_708962 [Fusarium redolens]